MNIKRYTPAFVGILALMGFALAVPAFAQTASVGISGTANATANAAWQGKRGAGAPGGMRGMMKPAVFGTVSAINGTTITVSGKQGFGTTATAATFSVDATNATVKKNNATSTLSSIAVGDTVMAQGTITGTNVVATMIRDGVMTRTPGAAGDKGKGPGGMGRPGMASSTPPITGNGQPVIAGKISAVSGNSLTVTTQSNITYTVDVSSAKIVQGKDTVTVSNLVTGDSVIVQGAVNGTSITASSVIDQKAPAANASGTAHGGIFAGIGNFFKHLFGF